MPDQQADAQDSGDQGQSLAAMAAQADQDQQASGAAAGAADAKPADAQDEGAGQEDGQDDPQQVIKFYDEMHGHRDAEKYRNDLEWFQKVDQMERLLGQRNEDAVLGKKLREELGGREVDVAAMLASQTKVAEPADDTWDPTWLAIGEDGGLRPAMGAPKDVLQRYVKRLNTVLASHDKDSGTEAAKRLKDLEDQIEATKGEMARQEARSQVEVLCERHGNLLYVGGDPEQGMTAAGKEILEEVNDAVREAEGAGLEPAAVAVQAQAVLKRSLRLAAKLQPKNVPGKPAPKRAGRQPSMAAAQGRSDEETDKIMATNGGLSKILQERYEAHKAAAP